MNDLGADGIRPAPTLLRGALPAALCAHWVERLAPAEAASRPLSALPLNALDVLQHLANSSLGPLLEHALGAAPWCDIDQSWLRHGRPPHSWHQDGALRHDFMAHHGRPAPIDAALEMRTAWIALTDCGVDAPGLEWLAVDVPTLLTPGELGDDALATRHPLATRVAPRMSAGDVLLFDGLLLHRTQVLPAVHARRSSLELRFFRAAALPARVAGDAGLRLPTPRAGATPQ
jgi:hypothetical protein